MKDGKNVTSLDLALACGVSQGTVDRALNDRPGIKPETKRRILEQAEVMGFRLNLSASSLATGRNRLIGLVLFDLENRFFAQMANCVTRSARQAGYHVQLMLTGKDPIEEQYCLDQLAGRRVDGVILCTVQKGEAFVRRLREARIPVVLTGNRIPDETIGQTDPERSIGKDAFPFVGIDDFRAMHDAICEVLARGYRRLVFLAPSLSRAGKGNLYAQEQRLAGARSAFSEFGLPAGSFRLLDRKPSEKLMNACIPGPEPDTVLVCSSDLYALDMLHLFTKRGFQLPRDLGLLGFDNLDILRYVSPRPATVDIPMNDLGDAAVRMLLESIGGRTPESLYLPHAMIPGETLR